jgi:Tol biopolymer transport system component
MSRFLTVLASLVFTSGLRGQVTTPPANGQSPVVSPDGRRVHYSSERHDAPGLYVVDDDGSRSVRVSTPLAGAGRGTWSADGSKLLLGRIIGDSVHVLSLSIALGTPTEVGRVPAPGARAVAVSRDGMRIVYGAGPWPAMQLFTVSLGGGAPRQITSGPGANWCPAISPDGRRVAAGRMDSTRTMQVWVVNVDGSGARPVTRFTSAQGNPQCPAWSADGRQLAVQSLVRAPGDSTREIGTIWVVDVASGSARQLAPHAAPYLDELPSWFPDGRIAFQSDRTGRWEVWVMGADGSGARQLTN